MFSNALGFSDFKAHVLRNRLKYEKIRQAKDASRCKNRSYSSM